ncbi:DUF2264 domain-containing protein [Actinoplanes sp. NBC_00393]|uniref:DUF2264 domain-containing protein n=1 Tax=Actinoplanes sp. NBC_00393 TaxID=2975953 RepID=UPI002E21C832
MPDIPLQSRDDWLRLADRLLIAARQHASPGHARITPPGPAGGYGHDVDGLEGFARTFLIAGFRIAGSPGDTEALADWYATGIATGTDPAAPDRWVRLDEHSQAKVEAASLALILDLTRPWIWDRLTPSVQERVVDYLAPAVGDDTYPRINWVWFRLVVQTFLRSVGGPHSLTEMAEDLATHDTFRRAGGWLADGPERAYDHYAGWALHLYPTLWARMAGAADLAAARRDQDVAELDRYLQDAVALIGADGSPLIQGRSLIYRFAAAAPFWIGALAGVPSVRPGLLRHAATRVVGHFTRNGVPDHDGLLNLGWHHRWPKLAQSYSGPGSPYWAGKGLLGIALPAGHPVWTAQPEPLPVEAGDTLRALRAPGWILSGTRDDGIVRVLNHGTDHAVEGSTSADSPLYARLGYSTATAPVLTEQGWTEPADMSVTLVDADGRRTHRTGMRTLTIRTDDDGTPVGVAGSTGPARWVEPGPPQPDHGGGRTGESRQAGHLTVLSLVRGPWEVRLARADRVGPAAVTLRFSGWPVAGAGPSTVLPGAVTVTGGRLTSRLVTADQAGDPAAGLETYSGAGPLGDPVRVPWLDQPVRPGVWTAVLAELTGGATGPGPCRAEFNGRDALVTWPDGVRTRTRIDTPQPGPVPRALITKE